MKPPYGPDVGEEDFMADAGAALSKVVPTLRAAMSVLAANRRMSAGRVILIITFLGHGAW
ncbi:MAG: hypothetical protein V9E81_10730 [Marmoricola sp.]